MKLRRGDRLDADDRAWLLAHVEPWSLRRKAFRSTSQWLRHTRFALRGDGALDRRGRREYPVNRFDGR